KKAAEPPKPAAPALPPPRLVKMKHAVAEAEPEAEAPAETSAAPAAVAHTPAHEERIETPSAPSREIAEHAPTPIAAAPAPTAEPPARAATLGRLVQPKMRLRIEEQRPTTPTPPLPTSP